MRQWPAIVIPAIGLAILIAAQAVPSTIGATVIGASLFPAPAGWADGRTAQVPDRLDALDSLPAYSAPIPFDAGTSCSARAIVLPRWTADVATRAAAPTARVAASSAGSVAHDEAAVDHPVGAEPVATIADGSDEASAPAVIASDATRSDVAAAASEAEPANGSADAAIERRALLSAAARWIARFEGSTHEAYVDHLGNLTVGIGCNLDAGDGDERLASVDADYEAVRAGADALSESQIARLFARDLANAVDAAERLVPDLYAHPPAVRVLVVDLIYTAGPTGFSRFAATRAAIAARDYAALVAALPRTRWYGQVHERGRAHLAALRQLIGEG